jgi:hypothetical protein
MKHLVGKVITRKAEFMGEEVDIRKLSVKEVTKIQELVKKLSKSKVESYQLKLLTEVIKLAVVDAEEITDEEFYQFPLDELNKLSNSILSYSGLTDSETVGN